MRRLKILVVHPMSGDGTSFYRGIGPLSHLERHFDFDVIDGEKIEFAWQRIIQCDVLYMCRPSLTESYQIIQIAKNLKKPVISEYDDSYLSIPPTNPRYELYANPIRQLIIKDCMKESDMVICSTKAIADEIVENVPSAKTVVINNAYDEDLFEMPEKRNQEKIVLFRAGDTKANDLLVCKDAILKSIFDHPQYTWAFMGFFPEWITSNKDIPNERLKLYSWQDISVYFERLMQLRPEITIVPLEETQFNRAKSNNNFIEATLCGSLTVGPKYLPEFDKPGIIHYHSYEGLAKAFSYAVNCNQDAYFELSKESTPRLMEMNKLRNEVIRSVIHNNRKNKFRPVVVDKTAPAYTDKEFFEFAYKMGASQENQVYLQAHYNTAQWLIDRFNPDSVIEFGSGFGATLEKFHLEQIYALGVELNPHFIEYFRNRNPNTAHLMIHGDITSELAFPRKFDIGMSLEVFEHISMPEEKWDALLTHLAKNIKHFYFSSTPYQSDAIHDHMWGHVNVRRSEKWIELFARNGWKFIENPNRICPWDHLYESQIFEA